MFTVWLWSTLTKVGDEWVCHTLFRICPAHIPFPQVCKKEPPLLLFRGASSGKIAKEVAAAVGDQAEAVTTENGWMNGNTML